MSIYATRCGCGGTIIRGRGHYGTARHLDWRSRQNRLADSRGTAKGRPGWAIALDESHRQYEDQEAAWIAAGRPPIPGDPFDADGNLIEETYR